MSKNSSIRASGGNPSSREKLCTAWIHSWTFLRKPAGRTRRPLLGHLDHGQRPICLDGCRLQPAGLQHRVATRGAEYTLTEISKGW